jgi:hypothetical protein
MEWLKQFDIGPDRPRTLEILRDGKKFVLHVPVGKLGLTIQDAKID